jgi:hypothetical protein
LVPGAVELVRRRHQLAVRGVGDEDVGVAVEQQDQRVHALDHLAQQGALGLQLRLALLERRDVAVEAEQPAIGQRARVELDPEAARRLAHVLRAAGLAHQGRARGHHRVQPLGRRGRRAEVAALGLEAQDVLGAGAGIGDVLGEGLELHQLAVGEAPPEVGVVEHHAVGQVVDDGRQHAALLLERELGGLERGDVADEGEELAVLHHPEVVLDPGAVLHARGEGDGAGAQDALAALLDEGLVVLHRAEIAARDHVAQDVLVGGAGARQLGRQAEQLAGAVGILEDGAVGVHQDDDVARAAQQVLDAGAAGGESLLRLARLGDVAAEGEAPAGGRVQDGEREVPPVAGLPANSCRPGPAKAARMPTTSPGRSAAGRLQRRQLVRRARCRARRDRRAGRAARPSCRRRSCAAAPRRAAPRRRPCPRAARAGAPRRLPAKGRAYGYRAYGDQS